MRGHQIIQSLHSQCGSRPLANYSAVPNRDSKLEKSKITSPLTPVSSLASLPGAQAGRHTCRNPFPVSCGGGVCPTKDPEPGY